MKRQAGMLKKTVQHLKKPLNIEDVVDHTIYLVPFVENLYDELTGVFIDDKGGLTKLKNKITIRQNLDDLGIDISLIGKQDKILLYDDFTVGKEKFSFLFIEITNIYFKSKKLKGYSPVNFKTSNAISLLAYSILLSL